MCVAGVRKLTFSTPIVTTTEKVTRIMVNSRYWLVKSKLLVMRVRRTLPRRGTEREVGGMISARRRKNTVRESKMEMERDTCKGFKHFKF